MIGCAPCVLKVFALPLTNFSSAPYFQGSYQLGTNQGNCSSATSCNAGQFYTALATTTSDNVCASYTNCTVGQMVAVNPTSSSDRSCSNCILGRSCIANSYFRQALKFQNISNQHSCNPISTCSPGTYITRNATTTSDVVCTACLPGLPFYPFYPHQ